MNRSITENLDGARMCYLQCVKDLDEGRLILTGTEEDNIHLRFMNTEYKQQFGTNV